jgi:hypothetical protein
MESIKQPGDRTAQRQAQLTNNIESDQNQINSEQEPSEKNSGKLREKRHDNGTAARAIKTRRETRKKRLHGHVKGRASHTKREIKWI